MRHNSSHRQGLETFQSLQPSDGIQALTVCMHWVKNTLQMHELVTRTFLAARSLCTNPLAERYCIPRATCWENLSNIEMQYFHQALILQGYNKEGVSIWVAYVIEAISYNLLWSNRKKKIPLSLLFQQVQLQASSVYV